MTYILFIIGFLLLIKGADLLVSGSASLAKAFNVPTVIIGLTVIAFGTSMPELFVNIMSSIKGNSQIAIGNILGSNIFNIFIVLGISAAIYPLTHKTNTEKKEIYLNLISIVVLAVMANFVLIGKTKTPFVGRFDAIVMFALFFIFFFYLLRCVKNEGEEKHYTSPHGHVVLKAVFLSIIGLAGLLIGAQWIVNGAVAIATKFGISQLLISSTIIAGGTSLPELAASIMAAKKKEYGMAVGNVIGSNIFNILFILGLSGLIRPLPVESSINIDISFAILASVLLLITFMTGNKKYVLVRWQGITFIFIYIGYVIFLIMRG